jgi:flagellar biosynthesis chaperone FliJ
MENLDQLEKQISLNVTLERLIAEYSFEEVKKTKKIKAFIHKIKSYKDKIKSTEKYKNRIENENLKQRSKIFTLTCKNMIKKLEEDIKEMEEDIEYKRRYVIDSCWEILNEAIRSGNIHESTILKKGTSLIYMLPSGKFVFSPQQIVIENEKVLKKFLLKNKLNVYIDGEEIYLNLIKKDVSIAEDGSILNDDGLVFQGLSLSDPKIEMEVFK